MKWAISRWLKKHQIEQDSQEEPIHYRIRKPCRYWEFEKSLEKLEKRGHDS
ncbi:hypothetical protein HNQ80_002344 [Anaerosolibacter carboniphilus]|uniref:Uncharacterized protein n=1 Tax=Anaerosolibacter carboniphilus TaxID=1417629 RepID=A0A841L1K4_9FIRM|nr:hypothetical protein [Anaerosolibacter carboniphilus]